MTAVGWRRPCWIVGAAALGMLLATGGVGGSAAERDTSPEAVVQEYLRVLRAGDARAARAYAEAVDEMSGASDDLLVSDAMATDWTVIRLVRRHHEYDEPATVDVVMAAADGTAREGRFELERRDGRWTILTRLAKVDFSLLPMRYVELNGVTTQAEVVWLFPGAYRAYDSDLIEVGAPTYVAVPGHHGTALDGQATLTPTRYLPVAELTDAGLGVVHDQLGEWFDHCAATRQPFPHRCPFAAGDEDGDTIYVGSGDYDAAGATVSWQVVTYPRVWLVQADGAFTGQLIVPGKLRISGTRRPLYGEGREEFRGECTVRLDELRVTLARPERFSFHIDPDVTLSSCGSGQYYG